MAGRRIPDYTGMLWAGLGLFLLVGLVARIPVVGEPIAFVIVLLIVVGWIVSAAVKAARPRQRR